MKATTSAINYTEGELKIALHPKYADDVQKLAQAVDNGKYLDIEIKIHRKHRSLNANAALWAMINDMAIVLQAKPMEIYINLLRDYGVSRFIPLFPEDAEREKENYRITEPAGQMYSNGYKILVWQVWDGSSKYNTLEFSRLLDGCIQEAKALGVDFISKADRDLVLSTWEQDRQGAKL